MNTPSTSTNNPMAKQPLTTTLAPAQHNLITSFFEQNLQENFNFFTETAQQFYKDQLNKRLTQATPNQGLFAYLGNLPDICGFIWGTPAEGGVATIIWLIVDNQYQNQGAGKQLLDHAKTVYGEQNAHKIKLTVHQERAKKFYLREGFVEEGYHPLHWWGLSCWSMAYFLS